MLWDIQRGSLLVIPVDKPYGYMKWLQYLLDHFLIPWGYFLHGRMTWQGEDEEDTGVFVVERNVITVLKAGAPSESLEEQLLASFQEDIPIYLSYLPDQTLYSDVGLSGNDTHGAD